MKSSTSTKIVFAGLILVLACWLGFAFTTLGHPVEKWGVFGDKFGALNCLFTGLALVGLVAGYWHEREQAQARDAEQRELLQAMLRQTEAQIRDTMFHAKVERRERLRNQLVTLARRHGENHPDTLAITKEMHEIDSAIDSYSNSLPDWLK